MPFGLVSPHKLLICADVKGQGRAIKVSVMFITHHWVVLTGLLQWHHRSIQEINN